MRKSRRIEENMNRKNMIKAEKLKNELSPSDTSNSGKNLMDLTKDVLVYLLIKRQKWMTIKEVIEYFSYSQLKVLTILFVFEGLGMIKILDNRRIVFLGVQGAIQQFIAFVLGKVEDWKVRLSLKLEKEKSLQKTDMLK